MRMEDNLAMSQSGVQSMSQLEEEGMTTNRALKPKYSQLKKGSKKTGPSKKSV